MSAYIFLGQELGKKQDAVTAIKEKLKKNGSAEEFTFYGDESPAGTIIDTLQNQGLFADSKIVIVKNAEAIKKKDEIDQLVSWTKTDSDENTVLILLSDENRLAAGFANAKANQQIFYEMFENEKKQWLKDFFKREGFSIDNDCIDTILELIENNTEALKRDCFNLINFIKAQTQAGSQTAGKPAAGLPANGLTSSGMQTISHSEVEKWLSHNREESAFTLFSRIAAGDLTRALESLSVMLAAKESASGILAGLAWCFRKLADYLTLIDSGSENNSFELKKIGLSSPKSKNDYLAASRRYNSDTVEECLALTAHYDLLLRSPVAVMEKILMDRYILAIISAGRG